MRTWLPESLRRGHSSGPLLQHMLRTHHFCLLACLPVHQSVRRLHQRPRDHASGRRTARCQHLQAAECTCVTFMASQARRQHAKSGQPRPTPPPCLRRRSGGSVFSLVHAPEWWEPNVGPDTSWADAEAASLAANGLCVLRQDPVDAATCERCCSLSAPLLQQLLIQTSLCTTPLPLKGSAVFESPQSTTPSWEGPVDF